MTPVDDNLLTKGRWKNEPADWSLSGDQLTATTDARSDFWRATYYGFTRDSGHHYSVAAPDAFTAEMRVRADYRHLYDQAGLMVRGAEGSWVKTGVEFTDGATMLSAVVTNGQSDWSVTRAEGDLRDLWIRVTVAKGAIRIQTSADRSVWPLLRLAPFPITGPLRVGPMLCTPERAGLVVTFSDFSVGPATGKDFHDLS